MEISKQGDEAKEPKNPQNKPLHAGYHIPLSLVVVGTETALFEEGSKVRERIFAYTKPFKEVHIIVLCGGSYKKFQIDNVTVHPTNSSSRVARFFDGIRIGKQIKKAAIVTVQDPFETGLVGHFIAKRLHAPLHVQVHTDFLSPAYASLSFLNRLRVIIAGFVLRRAKRIRVVSERIKESIERRYQLRARISVLPIFVDVARFARVERLKHPRFKIALLVISRLESEKNVSLAVRGLKSLRDAGHDAGLIIAGEGREHAALKALARSLQLERFVEFIGWQETSKVLQTADILLFPSHYDGYGMAIVEALAASVPVLSTDVGVAAEAGAIVVSPKTFSAELVRWASSGPRTGELKNYPYKSFDEYVRAYSDDIAACTKQI